MHSKTGNIEIMINNKVDGVIEKLFESLLNRHQIGLEISMRSSDFFFNCIHLLYYKCHKMNFKRGALYIESPGWIKNIKATVNPVNKKGNRCFQYAVTIALNLEEIRPTKK